MTRQHLFIFTFFEIFRSLFPSTNQSTLLHEETSKHLKSNFFGAFTSPSTPTMSKSPHQPESCHCLKGKFIYTHTAECTSINKHPSFCHCMTCKRAPHPTDCQAETCVICASDRVLQKSKTLEEQGIKPHVHLRMTCPVDHVLTDNMFCDSCEEGGPKHGLPLNGEETLVAFAEVCDTCEKEHPGAFWVSEGELSKEKPEGY